MRKPAQLLSYKRTYRLCDFQSGIVPGFWHYTHELRPRQQTRVQ